MTNHETAAQPPARWPEELRAAFWTAVNAPTYDESAAATLHLVRQLAGTVAEAEATQWPGPLADLIDPTRAAVVSVPLPADQAVLRTLVAQVLRPWMPGGNDADVDRRVGHATEAVLALPALTRVVPPPAPRADDRAAVLREAADELDAHASLLADVSDDPAAFVAKVRVRAATEWRVAAALLRRMAAVSGPRVAGEQQNETRPRRGDQFEAWLKAQRDEYEVRSSPQWGALDEVLDTYRLHADVGASLGEHVCEGRVVGDCECLEQPDTAPAVVAQPSKEV